MGGFLLQVWEGAHDALSGALLYSCLAGFAALTPRPDDERHENAADHADKLDGGDGGDRRVDDIAHPSIKKNRQGKE